MNKTAIKNFAIWARVQLIEAAKQRAYEYEITEKGENKSNLDTVAGRLLTSDEKQQRQQLIEQIRRKGYAQVMEEAAYTWFNRFIALRFMEVNGLKTSRASPERLRASKIALPQHLITLEKTPGRSSLALMRTLIIACTSMICKTEASAMKFLLPR